MSVTGHEGLGGPGSERAGLGDECMLEVMSRDTRSPVGEALAWASRLMAVGFVMFLPAVGGGWADARLGTSWLAPVGLVLGFGLGLTWLVRLTSGLKRRNQ